MSQKVRVEPHHIFTLHREARNSLFFSDEQTIVFPSGNNCVHYNIHLQRTTEYIRGTLPYQQYIQSLAISPDRRYMAVSECKKQGIITVHDLQEKQCFESKVLTGGSISVREFVCMAFSSDSKYLLGQSGGPEWTLFYWEWKMNEVIATAKITRMGFVSQVSFNPKDNTQVCVSGKNVFKIYKLENNSLNETSSFRMDLENIVSHAWMSEDCIVSGTESGKLLMLKAGHWKQLRRPSTRRITAIMPYSKGFACAAGAGLVYLYEKNEEHDYINTKEISILQDPYNNQPSRLEQQEITSMCLSPSEERLVISTRQGQIYHISLASIKSSQSKQANFEFLSQFVYLESITDLSTCSSKPLFATCSSDNSVCIWNYMTNSLELYKEFPEILNCISLHPNGRSILLGFSDKVCLMNLLGDEFRIVKEFNICNCTECVFSHDGNVFATVSNNLINICNIRTGEILELHGNMSEVLSVKWSEDDRSLMSCALDGFVYVWNTLTGACKSQNMQETHIFTDVIFSPNTGTIFGVASSFILNEFRDGQILWEIFSGDMAYTAISMTHSCQAIFFGTAIGTVRVLQYPLEEEKSLTEYEAHSGPITKMVVTPDDQYLLTASEDGSLLIWTITDQKGCKLSMVKETSYLEEVLCFTAFVIQEEQEEINKLKQEEQEKFNKVTQEEQEKIHKPKQEEQEKFNKVMQEEQEKINKLKQEEQEKFNKVTQEEQEKIHKPKQEEQEKFNKVMQEEQEKINKLKQEEQEKFNKVTQEEQEKIHKPKQEEQEKFNKVMQEEQEKINKLEQEKINKVMRENQEKIHKVKQEEQEKFNKVKQEEQEKFHKVMQEEQEKFHKVMQDEQEKIHKLKQEKFNKVMQEEQEKINKLEQAKINKVMRENQEKIHKVKKEEQENINRFKQENQEKINKVRQEEWEKLIKCKQEKIHSFKQEEQEKINKLRQNYIQQIEDLSNQIQVGT
ncbi:cilia- and flagella-associated protein 57-like [Neoarius graeffei]|uniref:cilia- and flagella-associated protein 57-like n=1 Tax=Neoarius graeffei TaxID=443677 RepID=UPI00298C7321|nr:cilia- and flagella-associated protein 57-like [Neoarius graeffei]